MGFFVGDAEGPFVGSSDTEGCSLGMPLGIEEILGDSLPVIDGFDDTEGSTLGTPLGIDEIEG